ncbi:MAG: inorganic phosphate transporter [Chloroflexi bacterium]|nr:inorganic phosphate transporter [Chloroflexota bacterium]
MSLPLIILFFLAAVYGYLNGQYGSASIVSTMISSRSIGPRLALWLAAVGMFLGPFVLGTAVANTISRQFIRHDTLDSAAIIATLAGAILWCSLTLWLKLPVSISQSLIGGLMGAAWAGFGQDVILTEGLVKVLIGLFLSPLLGLVGGYVAVLLSYALSASATPHLNRWFQRGQVLASLFMALSFGSNDGQKLMGIVALGLVSGGLAGSTDIPLWVTVFSAAALGVGTLMGGWRLIHTMGGKFYKIRPIHGFGAQVASTAVIWGSGLMGWPVSGSQVVTSAIVGAGSADRIRKVRWGVVQQILIGWVLTIPASAIVSALLYPIVKYLATR